jgi:hypothetical protein
MGLDFAILGENGAPEAGISIGMDAHHRLLHLSGGSPLLERVAEYYQDAEFVPAEIPALLREIETLCSRVADDEELLVFLRSLGALASRAHAAKVPIAVIAD